MYKIHYSINCPLIELYCSVLLCYTAKLHQIHIYCCKWFKLLYIYSFSHWHEFIYYTTTSLSECLLYYTKLIESCWYRWWSLTRLQTQTGLSGFSAKRNYSIPKCKTSYYTDIDWLYLYDSSLPNPANRVCYIILVEQCSTRCQQDVYTTTVYSFV